MPDRSDHRGSDQGHAPDGLPLFQTRIFIEPDGSVVIENLSDELLELARELDPSFGTCEVPTEGLGPTVGPDHGDRDEG